MPLVVMEMSPEVRIIKRYTNRKLYDTQHSKYVTLKQIAEMIRNGDEVRIVDNKTKDDLTSVTLAQIILEEEKKQNSFLPLQAMRNIIQNGGGSISNLVTQAQKRMTTILPHKGEEAHARNKDEDREGEKRAEVADSVSEGSPQGGGYRENWLFRELCEWVANSQKTIDAWQHKVDERLRTVRNRVESILPIQGIQRDLVTLSSIIAGLEAKLRSAQREQSEPVPEAKDDSPSRS